MTFLFNSEILASCKHTFFQVRELHNYIRQEKSRENFGFWQIQLIADFVMFAVLAIVHRTKGVWGCKFRTIL